MDAKAIETVITKSDSAQLMIDEAKEFGSKVARELNTTQIRALFGEVRQIQAEWSVDRARAKRRLILLRPKMAYRARAERGKGVKMLVDVLDPAVVHVTSASDSEIDGRFARFVELFEAILAYHRAAGGK